MCVVLITSVFETLEIVANSRFVKLCKIFQKVATSHYTPWITYGNVLSGLVDSDNAGKSDKPTTRTQHDRGNEMRDMDKDTPDMPAGWKDAYYGPAPTLADFIRDEIKKSNLQYLWNQEGKEFTLTEECDSSTYGAELNGDFISCLMGSKLLPAGTKGLLFVSEKIHYSEYGHTYDYSFPVVGADIIKTGAYYTFCTIVELPCGVEVLTSCFKSVDHSPKIIGKVQ